MKRKRFCMASSIYRIGVGLLIIIMVGLSGCSNQSKKAVDEKTNDTQTDQALHEKLNGTWQSDIMTVTFDFNGGTYSGVAMGEEFSKKLTLVSEEANIVVFKSDDAKVVCQFQNDGSIMLTKEGGIPVTLTPVK